MKNNSQYETWDEYIKEWEEDLLRYGKILTDDDWEDSDPTVIHPYYVRIRTIAYDNHIYYHKMVNGEVIEIKELK